MRQQRVNSFLQRGISQIIHERNFPGLTGLVTIHKVEVTADMREAKVWLSSIGQASEEVLRILNQKIYEIQRQLYRDAKMRVVPKIIFRIDYSEEYSRHINEILEKLHD